MKSILPRTMVGRWELALLPFKAFIPGSVVVLLISADSPESSEARRIIAGVIYSSFVCIAVLLVGGAVAAIRTHERRLIWSALAFAGAGLLVMAVLWGGAFPTPTKGP